MPARVYKTDKEQLLAEAKKVGMVIDNAPWHKKAFRLVQEEALEEYSDIRKKIELIKRKLN